MDVKKVYAFEYCCDIHESSFELISLHYTRVGAEKSMINHKSKAEYDFKIKEEETRKYILENYPEFFKEFDGSYHFGIDESWRVIELEINE